MSSQAIAAVLFDAYGTLFDLGSALCGVEAELGVHGPALGELWRRKQLEYSWLRSLMGRHGDFAQVTADGLDYALEALGIADTKLRARLLDAYGSLQTYPEVPAALQASRERGFGTSILSNGTPAMLESAVTAAGLGSLLDHVLSVEAVGVFKPDPRVYRYATDRLGLPPGRIGFVSSNGWDAHGAASFGFRTFWLNRAGQPDERLPGQLADVIPDLARLPDLLSRPAGNV
jgi:2-haloacid dehalogenase